MAVESVATPEPFKLADPRRTEPFMKRMVPEAGVVPVTLTVAMRFSV